ncbi:MAG TPA: hypothetical protein VJV23_16380 [Candidatus Polarisedimenticolia bacterium]|nr:hypothetical protein [Candidatus Polarisedimenticolia bacterium]
MEARGHVHDDHLVLIHYGEEAPAGARRHLEGCAACRTRLEELRQVLALVGAAPVPERGPGYGAAVWRRLQPRLSSPARPEGASRPAAWWRGRMALAASLLIMLMAAYLAGRIGGGPAPDGSIPEDVRQRVLRVAVADHLERCQHLLTELTNAGAAAGAGSQESDPQPDLTLRQRQAETLLAAGRIYRQTAEGGKEHALAGILEDVERVLLEVAHAPARPEPRELESIRRRVEETGILFKVRVMATQIRGQERTPAPARPGRRT